MIQPLQKILSLKNTRIIATLCFSRFPFSTFTASPNPEPKSNAIADYLIKSCGFSPQRAVTVSNYAVRRFPPDPNSVRHFFKHHGFTDAQFHSAISRHYNILWADLNITLEPNFKALCGAVNFSASELCRFVASNPQVLTFHGSIPRLEFWKNFLNNDMKKLLSVFTKNPCLISQDINRSIAPKIALLQAYGLSQKDIGQLLVIGSGFFRKSTTAIETALKTVQELGFLCGSSMFLRGVTSLGRISTSTFKSKMEFLKSHGWSETEFYSALRKFPGFMALSCKNIQETMEFLEGVGCTESYIALRPRLLSLSLEKRLRPRCHVLEILKLNNLVTREWDLYSIMILNERRFLEKMIIRYSEQAPNLHETYISACANKTSLGQGISRNV